MPNLHRFTTPRSADPPTPDGPAPQLDRANIRAACDASLRRLQTTYIDLYQLHWCAAAPIPSLVDI